MSDGITFANYRAQLEQAPPEKRSKVEEAFFKLVWNPNQTAKTTAKARLDDFCQLINEQLPSGSVELLDVGVSSGVTTSDWHRILTEQGINHDLTGIDICTHASLNSLFGWLYCLKDSSGNTLGYQIGGRVFENFGGNTMLSRLKRLPVLFSLRGIWTVLSPFVRKVDEFPLLSHEVLAVPQITIVEMNLMDVAKLGREFDAIRVANILNLVYFSKKFLSEAVKELTSILKEDGLLCIIRTDEETDSNHGTIFRKRCGRLNVAARLGAGSELEPIVDQNSYDHDYIQSN